MANKPYRIILDTNLWISFLITKSLSRIDKHIFDGTVTLVFSEESLEEFIEVVNRPKFKKYFKSEDISDLMD